MEEESAATKEVQFTASTVRNEESRKRLRRKRSSNMQVTRDGINFGIPSRQSVHKFSADTHGKDSWKTNALQFIHQKSVQMALMGLLCLDILIIFTELFLMSEFPQCRLITRDCLACCPGSEAEAQQNGRWLSGDGGDQHEEICQAGYEQTGEPECDSHKWQTVHIIEEVLFYITISILV